MVRTSYGFIRRCWRPICKKNFCILNILVRRFPITTDRGADGPRALIPFWPSYAPTPLLDLPKLAAWVGVDRVWVKNEGARPLGSFKVLGGMYAGLKALARASGAANIATLIRTHTPSRSLPALLCASDGNHGLAVAAGAKLASAAARVYLHARVPRARADRIGEQGAEIVWAPGTYDDAVHAAAEAARRGDGLLIADTSDDPDDPVVADVMAGYGLMAEELVEQLRESGDARPTHLFVQAGVGGLAAALAVGMRDHMANPRRIVVVEPEKAACVAVALKARRPVQIDGNLETAAEMLSCGLASAPALKILLRNDAVAITVGEAALIQATTILAVHGGPATTATGASGLAGLIAAKPGSSVAVELGIGPRSRIVLIATEGPIP